jgi:hypothetical protein
MKFYTFSGFVLTLSFSFAALPQPAHAAGALSVSAADCVGWFETWRNAAKAALPAELKEAQALSIEKRSLDDLAKPLEGVVAAARPLCARLEGQNIRPANPAVADTPTKVCLSAFVQWEDARDNAYAMGVFDKKLTIESKEFVDAQDIARREAKVAKGLCAILDKLH